MAKNKIKWKDHYCSCGCGISVRADDPGADKKIEVWKEKHKCKKKLNQPAHIAAKSEQSRRTRKGTGV